MVMFWERKLGVGCLDERTAVRKIIKLRIIFLFILNNSIGIENWRCFWTSFSHNMAGLAADGSTPLFFFKIIGKVNLLAHIGKVYNCSHTQFILIVLDPLIQPTVSLAPE